MKVINKTFVYGPSILLKQHLQNFFCLHETVNVLCIETKESKGCNVYNSDDIHLIEEINNFFIISLIFDDMCRIINSIHYNQMVDIMKLV